LYREVSTLFTIQPSKTSNKERPKESVKYALVKAYLPKKHGSYA